MKKSINFVMIAVAILIGFASCNNDENVDTSGGNTVPNGVATTAKITLTQSGPTTYAPTETEEAQPNEKVINTAILLIFDANQSFEQAVLFSDVSGTTVSETITTTTGTHYFYALINTPTNTYENVLAYTKGNISLDAVRRDIVPVTAISALTTNNDFFMTSLGEPTKRDLIPATVSQAEESSNDNNFEIQVGRAVAKVNVGVKTGADTDPSGGKLSEIGYKIHNNPIQMYLLPRFAGTQLLTPFYSAASVTSTNYFDNPLPYLATDNTAPSYAMENSNEVPKEGSATYISIKGVYTPKVVYNRNEEISIPAADNTFYRIWSAANNNWNEKFFNESPYPPTRSTG